MVIKSKRLLYLITVLFLLFTFFSPAISVSAQDYRFSLPEYEVEAYIEADGSVTLYYYMVFDNAPGAHPIDFIDLGLPNSYVDFNRIEADINAAPITSIKPSAYVSGAAELGLGANAIPAGQSGTVRVYIRKIEKMLYQYDQPDQTNYANFQFVPNYFGAEFDRSKNTKYRVTIILPPDVGAEDGVYYEPNSWPGNDAPEASLTTDNRVYYSWYTENADVHTNYMFGAAFPASAVPDNTVMVGSSSTTQSSGSTGTGINWGAIRSALPCLFVFLLFIFRTFSSARKRVQGSSANRMKYMPPKISIEGQGIKRGLTAVEAALLLELPIDRVLTMILFGLLKKEAVTVTSQEPLELEPITPLPEGLYPYEQAFIKSYEPTATSERRRLLKSMLIDLVKSVSDKMKGFSKAETKAYYKDIINRAWTAVEAAKTPEVKSAQYNETLEWTMMDRKFNERTERTFTGQPVFLPRWWPHYDPVYRRTVSTEGMMRPVHTPAASMQGTGSKGGTPTHSMPSLPGADFAAKMIAGTSNMAASTIGNLQTFTGGISRMTNPVPVQSGRSSSGKGGFRGGGGDGCVSCACACACAGCACACAGGGR